MNFDLIKRNYDRGLWSTTQVYLAVRKGVITQAQADSIIAGTEPESSDAVTPDEILNILNGGEA